jgi:hypothetical protein
VRFLTASCCLPGVFPPGICVPRPPPEDVLPYDLNDEDQLDLVPGAGTPAKTVGTVPLWKRIFWEGGRPVDAFLTVVSAQVGVCVGGWVGVQWCRRGKGVWQAVQAVRRAATNGPFQKHGPVSCSAAACSVMSRPLPCPCCRH